MECTKQQTIVQMIALALLLGIMLFIVLTFIDLNNNPCKYKTCYELVEYWSERRCFLASQPFGLDNISRLNLTNQTNGILQK